MGPPLKIQKLEGSLSPFHNGNRLEDSPDWPAAQTSDSSSQTSDSFDYIDWGNDFSPIREENVHSDSSFKYSSADQDEFLYVPKVLDVLMNNLPEEALPLIFQHLTETEVKIATNVSKLWHNKIIKCEELMKRHLKLNIEVENSESCFRLLPLLKSQRAYSKLKIFTGNDREVVKIIDAILKKFAASIVNLEIHKIGGYNSMLKKPLSFSKLESLELNVICGRLFCPFDHICTLKKLSINGLDPNELLPCLKQNPFLEKLVLYENSFISYFDHDLSSELPFKLRTLAVLDHINTDLIMYQEFPAALWDGKARVNFMKFLKSQRSNLTSLHMDLCFAEDLNRILKMLPALKSLEVNQLTGDLSKLSLDNYCNIATFIATKISDQLLTAVIASFSNMKSIFIENLRTHQFSNIIRNAHNLENFCYFWASKSEKVHGSFVNLKYFYGRLEIHEASCSIIDIQIMKKKVFLEMMEN